MSVADDVGRYLDEIGELRYVTDDLPGPPVQVGWLTKGGMLLPMCDRYGEPVTWPEGWAPYRPVYVRADE